MKQTIFTFLVFLFLISACSTPAVPTVPVVASETLQPTLAPVIPTVTPIPTLEPTAIPTLTPSPTPIPQAQQKIRAIMESYGKVDEKYLSASYWDRISQNIAKYGAAKRILCLEFHGDNYSMYGGAYSMTPESFADQMDYMMKNDYHFVTGPETIGFLEGWLQLPARSVILTTDSSAASMSSMPRVIDIFSKLEAKYGYPPHIQSFIWTQGMDPSQSDRCKGDVCWQAYRVYRDSGYITFGTHTESHSDFSLFTSAQTEKDLTESLTKIKDNLGLTVYAITWPYEACSPHLDLLTQLGIKYAYGGWTRSLTQLYTYERDNMPLCLPRLFPPNPDGGSGRPKGLTLKELLSSAQDQYVPIP